MGNIIKKLSIIAFVSGSYSNVVGLPLFETMGLLKAARP